ncbi:tetratricopeptide repeat protein [Granulosicoccaceae sp. 1_MG-2023]|nr:tetratricopeptide repeat protein [Granulosicoccaceae sp. 1_MG-2023]
MKDLTRLDITVHQPDALSHYNTAVAGLCRFKNPLPSIDTMLELEPGFPMGHILNATIHLWSTDRDDLPGALQSLAVPENQASAQLNNRERRHLAALQAWAAGDLHRASAILDQLLIDYPTDILALLSGHQLDFFLGDAANLRDRVARVLPAWDEQHPLYGYVLGMLSFGQEEAGHYEQAEETGLRAVARNPDDIWGIHAVAHACEMRNHYRDGATFLRDYEPHWSQDNEMITHNAIHLDLFLLETGELDEALRYYDSYVHHPGMPAAPMPLLDGSSVLWRLYLEGTDSGARAAALSEAWHEKDGQMFYAFNDAHAIMAYVMNGETDAADALVNDLRHYAREGDPRQSNHAMVVSTGLPVCEALNAFGRGDYNTAIEKLWPIKNTNARFGGSHAQRDVLARTLLESAIRSGKRSLSRALLNERLQARPQSPYNLSKLEEVMALH